MNSDNILVCTHILNSVIYLSATANPLLNFGNINNDLPCTDLLTSITWLIEIVSPFIVKYTMDTLVAIILDE